MSVLSALLAEKCARDGISAREVSRQTGVAHTTVIRVLKGQNVSTDTASKLSKWLGVSVTDVLDGDFGKKDLASQIAAVISADPELEIAFREAMRKIQDGEISQSTLNEVIRYVSWRLTGS